MGYVSDFLPKSMKREGKKESLCSRETGKWHPSQVIKVNIKGHVDSIHIKGHVDSVVRMALDLCGLTSKNIYSSLRKALENSQLSDIFYKIPD